VAGATALGRSAEQIEAGIAASLAHAAAAEAAGDALSSALVVFDLPRSATRPDGGLLVLTSARNEGAIGAWAEHFQQHFSGRRAHVLVDSPADWLATSAPTFIERLHQCFWGITIALNSHSGSLVEALEMARPGLQDRPFGQNLDLMASLDQLLEGRGGADLVCVAAPNPGGFLTALRHLETKGLSRRSVGGLASVRHCR